MTTLDVVDKVFSALAKVAETVGAGMLDKKCLTFIMKFPNVCIYCMYLFSLLSLFIRIG